MKLTIVFVGYEVADPVYELKVTPFMPKAQIAYADAFLNAYRKNFRGQHFFGQNCRKIAVLDD